MEHSAEQEAVLDKTLAREHYTANALAAPDAPVPR
jgi:hypothetical protein